MSESLSSFFRKRKTVKFLPSILFIIIVLTILGYLAFRNKDLLISYDWDIRWNYLLVALGLDGLALLTGSIVWGSIMRSLGIVIGFSENLHNFCINMLARRIPGTVWYIAYRSHFYTKYKVSITVSTLASGIEVIVSVVSALLVALILGAKSISDYISARWLLFPISLIGIGLLHPRVIRWIFKKFGNDVANIKYTDVFIWLMLYVVLWILSGIMVFVIANAVFPIEIQNFSVVAGGWALIGAFSYLLLFLPSNLGFNEVGISLILTSIVPASFAVIIALLVRICFICYELLWAGCVIVITQMVRLFARS